MTSQQLVQRILCAGQGRSAAMEAAQRVGTGQISNISCFLPLSQLAARVDPTRSTHSSRSSLRERPPSPSQADRPSFCKGNPLPRKTFSSSLQRTQNPLTMTCCFAKPQRSKNSSASRASAWAISCVPSKRGFASYPCWVRPGIFFRRDAVISSSSSIWSG
jgi:hypothetical protein